MPVASSDIAPECKVVNMVVRLFMFYDEDQFCRLAFQ